MFKKGMIITIKDVKQWRQVLIQIEEETDYLWTGGEGEPTSMSDSSFHKYSYDCAISINTDHGERVLQFGTFGLMKQFGEHKHYEVISADALSPKIRRF